MARGLVRRCDRRMLFVHLAYDPNRPASLSRWLHELQLVMERAPVTLLQRTALRHFCKLGHLDSSNPWLHVVYDAWYPELLVCQ